MQEGRYKQCRYKQCRKADINNAGAGYKSQGAGYKPTKRARFLVKSSDGTQKT